MKTIQKIGWLIPILVCVLFLHSSCEEKAPYINFSETGGESGGETGGEFEAIYSDTSFMGSLVDAQNKMVVIEEFTGVRCVNCPKGHEQTQIISDANPGRVIVLAIHAGFLTYPYPESIENYVIDEGSFLYDFMAVEAVPAAAVNRVFFDGEAGIALLNYNQWGGKVNQELTKTPPVNVYTYSTFDETSRELKVYAQMRFTETLSNPIYLTTAITENNIVDYQLIPSNGSDDIDSEYLHKHLLRDVLSSASGDEITNSAEAGRVIVKSYSTTLPENWKAEDIEIVAYVHGNGVIKDVYQGASAHIIE